VIDKRCLPVVNVRDDGDVAYVVSENCRAHMSQKIIFSQSAKPQSFFVSFS
jgi:hypothetical protein